LPLVPRLNSFARVSEYQSTTTNSLPVAQGTGSSTVERRASGGAGSIPATRE